MQRILHSISIYSSNSKYLLHSLFKAFFCENYHQITRAIVFSLNDVRYETSFFKTCNFYIKEHHSSLHRKYKKLRTSYRDECRMRKMKICANKRKNKKSRKMQYNLEYKIIKESIHSHNNYRSEFIHVMKMNK